jgi:putative ABC transport system ATP-binding protein
LWSLAFILCARQNGNAPTSRERQSLNFIPKTKSNSSPLSAPSIPLLRIEGLKKTYATPQGRLAVLKGVDFSLDAGSSTALMGESGSGKSTLLHLIAGLDEADAGEIWLHGTRVTALSDVERAALRRETLGVVFQQFNLIPSLTISDNLAFQARIADRLDSDWQEELIRRLGLKALLDRYPEQLSGGQQQRVAIGRALAVRPRLLLADEPTGNLDEASGDEVLKLALELVAATNCAFLMVTHSRRLAARLERQISLSSGVLAKP